MQVSSAFLSLTRPQRFRKRSPLTVPLRQVTRGASNRSFPLRDLIKTNAAILLVGIATFVLMGAGQSLYGPALPAFSRAFDISIGQAGLLVSAHWVGCAIGVAGMFIWGARTTPRIVVLIMAIGAALIATGFSWGITLLGAVVFGAGYGCATVVFNPRVLRAFGDRGPAMLSLLNATFGIGAIGAPLLFVALGNNPAMTFGVCAVACAALVAVAGPAGIAEARATAIAAEPFRAHWPALIFGGLAIAIEASLIGLGPAALIKAGETEVNAAKLLSAFFFAFLAARVLLIFTAHLLKPFSLYTLAMTGAFVGALGASFWSPGISFVVIGFFAGMFFPSEYVTATRKMGANPRVAPTIIAAGLVGGIFAPLIFAPFLADMGERGFFWIITGITGVLMVAALAFLRPMNR
jgi:MFS transporter, FHS family, glucose/mannose:H+ symporter